MRPTKTALILIIAYMLALTIVYALVGCTRTVKQVVQTHDTIFVEHSTTDTLISHQGTSDTVYLARTDTIYKVDVRHDSIYRRDSVYIRERGDTVTIYREHWNTKVDIRHDTIHHVKTDTILKLRHDTITLYRYAERKDTSAVVSQSDKETIKERTPFWLTLLKWLVPIGVLGVIIWFVRKWWRGR